MVSEVTVEFDGGPNHEAEGICTKSNDDFKAELARRAGILFVARGRPPGESMFLPSLEGLAHEKEHRSDLFEKYPYKVVDSHVTEKDESTGEPRRTWLGLQYVGDSSIEERLSGVVTRVLSGETLEATHVDQSEARWVRFKIGDEVLLVDLVGGTQPERMKEFKRALAYLKSKGVIS